MKIERNFYNKTADHNFGDVVIEFPTEGFILNGKPLPESSVRAIINQGLQILQDTYAGVGKSKTLDEAKAAFDNKLEALIEGTVGQRAGGTGRSPLEAMMHTIARESLRALFKAEGKPYKTFTERDADEQAEILEKVIDKLGRAKVEKEAQERLAAKNKVAANISLGDIL